MVSSRDGHPSPAGYLPAPGFRTAFTPGVSDHGSSTADDGLTESFETDEELGELESRYEWVVGLMSSFADVRLIRVVVAMFTASMGVCATLEILYGFGGTTSVARGVQIGSAAFAFVAALWWLATPWPRLRTAFAFVVLANIGIAAANVSANIPPAYAVGKTVFFVVLGLFAGVFLDRWMLATHIVMASTAVTAIIAYNVLFRDVPPLGALVVWAPVMSLILAIPVLLFAIVRAVRLDQT